MPRERPHPAALWGTWRAGYGVRKLQRRVPFNPLGSHTALVWGTAGSSSRLFCRSWREPGDAAEAVLTFAPSRVLQTQRMVEGHLGLAGLGDVMHFCCSSLFIPHNVICGNLSHVHFMIEETEAGRLNSLGQTGELAHTEAFI